MVKSKSIWSTKTIWDQPKLFWSHRRTRHECNLFSFCIHPTPMPFIAFTLQCSNIIFSHRPLYLYVAIACNLLQLFFLFMLSYVIFSSIFVFINCFQIYRRNTVEFHRTAVFVSSSTITIHFFWWWRWEFEISLSLEYVLLSGFNTNFINIIPRSRTSLEMDGTLDFECFQLGAKF